MNYCHHGDTVVETEGACPVCTRARRVRLAKDFGLFFFLQFILYFNATVDYRAVAKEQYAAAMLTNAVAPVISWVMVKKIGAAKNEKLGLLAVSSAGVLAALLGMWLTRHWR